MKWVWHNAAISRVFCSAHCFSAYLVIYVKNTFLDFVVDFSRCVDEGFLDIGCGLCWSLHKNKTWKINFVIILEIKIKLRLKKKFVIILVIILKTDNQILPCSRAKASPSSFLTSRRASRSLKLRKINYDFLQLKISCQTTKYFSRLFHEIFWTQ